MKHVRLGLFTLIMSAGVLGGCAFTDEQVKIDYTPSDYSMRSTSDAAIHVDRLRDARGVAPKLISYKGVQGKTGGEYLNDIEISELLTNSIKAVLTKMGYRLDSSQYDVTLTGEVLKFDSYCIMGFWSGSIEASIQLNLKLINSKDNSIIWNETVSGQGKVKGVQFDSWGNRKEAIDQAMDSLMRNIASSETLKAAINRI